MSEQHARVAGMPNQGIRSGRDNRVTAILLDPHEGRKEWVGEDCPVSEGIAHDIDEKSRYLNELGQREKRAEANGIEAGNDKRNRVQSQNSERREHNVGAIDSGAGAIRSRMSCGSRNVRAAALSRE